MRTVPLPLPQQKNNEKHTHNQNTHTHPGNAQFIPNSKKSQTQQMHSWISRHRLCEEKQTKTNRYRSQTWNVSQPSPTYFISPAMQYNCPSVFSRVSPRPSPVAFKEGGILPTWHCLKAYRNYQDIVFCIDRAYLSVGWIPLVGPSVADPTERFAAPLLLRTGTTAGYFLGYYQ